MAPRSTALPSAQTESARELRRNFYCEMCSKGYARITELEAHENSYDHQHRKRMKEMKQITRNPTAAVRANRQEKKRTENAEMISMNLKTAEAKPGERRGFRDIGAPVEQAVAPAPEAVKMVEREEPREVMQIQRPLLWEDLPHFAQKLDAATLPSEWQNRTPTATQKYLEEVSTPEKRRLYFDDDDEILEELGIGDEQWGAISEPSQPGADMDVQLDDDWEDFMQTDERKNKKNDEEALRREKIVMAWKQRQQQQFA